ncbi:cysteine--tRNA ligase, partial [bacterium]|nr:cysteine--tRNA ligase [bacterium]
FYTLRDLLGKGFHPMAIRYCVISNHYRSPMNLSMDALRAAHSAWSRIMDFKQRMQEKADANVEAPVSVNLQQETQEFLTRFTHHMNDDLDTPRACSVLFDFIREANKILDAEALSSSQANEVMQVLEKIDHVLGVMKQEDGLLDEDIERLIEERQEARKAKNYARADEIRDQLAEQGVILEDTREGMRWKRR